jgi:hypothetical protein
VVKLFFDFGKDFVVFTKSVIKFANKHGIDISKNDYKNALYFYEIKK